MSVPMSLNGCSRQAAAGSRGGGEDFQDRPDGEARAGASGVLAVEQAVQHHELRRLAEEAAHREVRPRGSALACVRCSHHSAPFAVGMPTCRRLGERGIRGFDRPGGIDG
jgi:hypothetical protein